jgi:hypothetical protein
MPPNSPRGGSMSIDISAVKTIGSGILRPEGVMVGLGAAEWVRTFE